jgi:dTDP-glucose 4,6-dehydratase
MTMNERDHNPLAEDLNLILSKTSDIFESLRNKNIFITGGTGFFGCWLLESVAWANKILNLNTNILVLSRNPLSYVKKAPNLANNPSIKFLTGEVTTFKFPEGKFDFVIHAATESSSKLNDIDPIGMINTIVNGTMHVLEFAKHAGVKRLLLTSSGAVYGKQPQDILNVAEDFSRAPDVLIPQSAYGEAKRLAELLCVSYNKQYNLECTIARCFAFVGPYLPLDIHYAVGNFIRDAVAGGPIYIKGDGTSYRSYMYAGDLASWLWTILVKGISGRAYNVGSDIAISISDLAAAVANCFDPKPEILFGKKPSPNKLPEIYVPNIDLAKKELSLNINVNLENSLRKTIRYYQWKNETLINNFQEM